MTDGQPAPHGDEVHIAVKDVCKAFGSVVAIDRLSFEVGRGEVVAILGPTGAGKSTILHAMLGAMAVDSGCIRVAGFDPFHERERLRGHLGVAFQNDRLLPWRRTWENVAVGLEIMGVGRAERRQAAFEWLARVKMAGAEEKFPHELSGGMRQRASFARAMSVKPTVLLLDETFNQLDEVTSKVLRADFLSLVHASRTTCVLVTHRIEEAIEAADRVLVFAKPAHLVSEIAMNPDDRDDPARLAAVRSHIQRAMETP